jgi:PAS domain-containing protein
MSKNDGKSLDAYYHDYNSQLSQLKKKHLAETQALEQKLLIQKQELERVLSLNAFPTYQSDQFYESIGNNDFIKDSSESKKLKKKTNSRHSSSVISHFTSSNEGYRRLAQELEGFLFILSSQATILFASNSCQKYLGTSTVSMLGQSLGKYIHPDDEEFVMEKLRDAFASIKSLNVYCRFKREASDDSGSSIGPDTENILMEMNGRPVIEEGESCPIFLVNVGREYKSKNSADLDSILTLRMENIKLRLQLKAELDRRTFQNSAADLTGVVEPELQVNPPLVSMKKEETARRRKKAKISVADLVCKECGTNSSPEWRRGPEGPKT